MKALCRPAQFLVLAEPTAVLTPQEVEEFFAILRRMREQGKTIVIITHKLAEVLAISDNVTVMRDGRALRRAEGLRDQPSSAPAPRSFSRWSSIRRQPDQRPLPLLCLH